MPAALDPLRVTALLDGLSAANLEHLTRYPGEPAGRQPIHRVYGGAQLFTAQTAVRLGQLARASMRTYAPTPTDLAEALGLEACFFVLVRTSEHEAEWQRRFLDAVRARPEVLEAHRLAGDIDYILKIRVRNARAYDAFYQALIAQVKIHNVTALLSMEEIKATTALPIPED